MRINRILYIVLLIVLFQENILAQESCTQKLRYARTAYQEGKLQSLPALLERCIISGFSKEEKVEALRLVTLANLYNENMSEAEASYLKLLNADPEFKPNEQADPTELLLLHDRFDTDPKFYWGIRIGAAYSLVQIIEPTKAINTSLGPGKYSFSPVIGGGLFYEYLIKPGMSANAELHFMQRTLNLNKSAAEGSDGSASQNIVERQSWIELPLLYNYVIRNKGFNLEATGGLAVHYLLSASITAEGAGFAMNNVDKSDMRRDVNLSGILGVRANFKSNATPYLSVSLLYQHKLLKEVDDSSSISDVELERQDYSSYGDGQYKSHAIWLRVGVRIPYYKPELK